MDCPPIFQRDGLTSPLAGALHIFSGYRPVAAAPQSPAPGGRTPVTVNGLRPLADAPALMQAETESEPRGGGGRSSSDSF